MLTSIIIILILLLAIIITLIVIYNIVHTKLINLSQQLFGTTDIKKAIELSEIEAENTPKSVSSMEPLLLDKISKDFPDLNINKIKSMVENSLLDIFSAIENQDIEKVKKYNSDKINSWVNSKIDDLNATDVHFDSIKFHRTVINDYRNESGIATMKFQTSLEYFYKKDSSIGRKKQDRYEIEFIYIIDALKNKVNGKAIGLNCPNCGAPVTSVGIKSCKYCGSEIYDLVKKTWMLNNIKQK